MNKLILLFFLIPFIIFAKNSNIVKLNYFANIIDKNIEKIPIEKEISNSELGFYFLKLIYSKTSSAVEFFDSLSRDQKLRFIDLFEELKPYIIKKSTEFSIDISDLELEIKNFEYSENKLIIPNFKIRLGIDGYNYNGSPYRKPFDSKSDFISRLTGNFEDNTGEYSKKLSFKLDLDPGLLYNQDHVFLKDLHIDFTGKNFSTKLFDFNIPNTDISINGALIGINDHRYNIGIYGGQNFLYRNSIGPDLTSEGAFLTHQAGPHIFSLRYSEYSNDKSNYFDKNNKELKEFTLNYNFMGNKFNADTNIYFTQPDDFIVFLKDYNWDFGFESNLEWQTRMWGTMLGIKYASDNFHREESTDIKDTAGGSLSLYRLLSERLKVFSNLSYYSHHDAETNEYEYELGISDYFHHAYEWYWESRFSHRIVSGWNYDSEKAGISNLLRMFAGKNTYEMLFSLNDENHIPQTLADTFIRELYIKNTHRFTPFFWSESKLGGKKENCWKRFYFNNSLNYRNRSTLYAFIWDYYDQDQTPDINAHHSNTVSLSIDKDINPHLIGKFYISETREYYSKDSLSNDNISVNASLTKSF